jgi:hypothetical protein
MYKKHMSAHRDPQTMLPYFISSCLYLLIVIYWQCQRVHGLGI